MVPPQLCDPFSRTETCKWHNLRFYFQFDELAKQFQPWMESLLFGHRCRLQWKAESNSNFQPGWTSTETRWKRSPTQVDSFVWRNRFNWAESFRFKLKYETENNRNAVITRGIQPDFLLSSSMRYRAWDCPFVVRAEQIHHCRWRWTRRRKGRFYCSSGTTIATSNKATLSLKLSQ